MNLNTVWKKVIQKIISGIIPADLSTEGAFNRLSDNIMTSAHELALSGRCLFSNVWGSSLLMKKYPR